MSTVDCSPAKLYGPSSLALTFAINPTMRQPTCSASGDTIANCPTSHQTGNEYHTMTKIDVVEETRDCVLESLLCAYAARNKCTTKSVARACATHDTTRVAAHHAKVSEKFETLPDTKRMVNTPNRRRRSRTGCRAKLASAHTSGIIVQYQNTNSVGDCGRTCGDTPPRVRMHTSGETRAPTKEK